MHCITFINLYVLNHPCNSEIILLLLYDAYCVSELVFKYFIECVCVCVEGNLSMGCFFFVIFLANLILE